MAGIHLIMANNSVRNTTFSCDSLGILYEVSKSDGIVSVHRWDANTSRNVLAGEFKLPLLTKDLIRFREEEPWTPLDEFLNRGDDFILSSAKSFVGMNGVKYKWRGAWGGLKLREDTEKKPEPLVVYHRHRVGEKSYLEIKDTSVMNTLDTIIITFLIMEKKKRDRDKAGD